MQCSVYCLRYVRWDIEYWPRRPWNLLIPLFICQRVGLYSYAVVNGHLELPLLKDRQRFDAVSTSNLEVYKFQDWWILTYFIFRHGESSLNKWSMVNLEWMCILSFYYFLCLKANLDLEKTNQLGESSPNFIFAVVNLDPIILEKRWIDGESWPNDFVEKVNRGEDLRWVGSRCPLTHALIIQPSLDLDTSIDWLCHLSICNVVPQWPWPLTRYLKLTWRAMIRTLISIRLQGTIFSGITKLSLVQRLAR